MHQKLSQSVLIVVITISILAVSIQAYPSWRGSRQKRVSDQRLAELQTLLALARMRCMPPKICKYSGFVDPAKLGRKKRSQGDTIAYETLTEDRADYDSRSEDDRDTATDSQEDDGDDVWRYLSKDNKIR